MSEVEELFRIMNDLGIPQVRLCNKSGIAESTFMRWKKNPASADPDRLSHAQASLLEMLSEREDEVKRMADAIQKATKVLKERITDD